MSATSTTEINSDRGILEAFNGSGLNGTGDILSQTHDGGAENTHWLSETTDETVTIDLGGGTAFDVDTIYLWAYNRPESSRGVKTFDIAFSTDGGSSFGTAVSASSLGLSNFAEGGNNANTQSSVQTRTITRQTGVTDIQLTSITNWGASDRIAIAEMRFGDSVPEPSAALLIGAVGALFILRRRR